MLIDRSDDPYQLVDRPPGKMTDTGWLSSYGQLLNQCCLCRTWLSEKRREFDGKPHRCNLPIASTSLL